MSPSSGTHARTGPGHEGASQHQSAHEGCRAAFSFIKSLPGGRPDDLWGFALSLGGSCPGGLRDPSTACAPAGLRRAGNGEGQWGIKRVPRSG